MAETPATSVEHKPEAVLVRVLAHDLDEVHIAGLRKGITEALSQSPSLPYIVDMTNVKFVPSLTLGALVGIVNEFRSRKQRLIFVSLQRTVRQVVTLTRLDRVMEIMDDANAALRSVGNPG